MPEFFEITRLIEIDAAHRVPTHGSKCFNVHGHRWRVEATCAGELAADGEQSGMVLDFGFLKAEMMAVIDAGFDHAMIAWEKDELLLHLKACCGKLVVVDDIPTSENLARLWYTMLAPRVIERSDARARLLRLRVYETPNCFADYPVRNPNARDVIVERGTPYA